MLTKDDIEQLGNVIDAKLAPIQKDIKSLKKHITHIKKTVDVVARLLDNEQMSQRKRIHRIEEHLGLPHPE